MTDKHAGIQCLWELLTAAESASTQFIKLAMDHGTDQDMARAVRLCKAVKTFKTCYGETNETS